MAREATEQQRLRTSYEKKLFSNIMSAYSEIGKLAGAEYELRQSIDVTASRIPSMMNDILRSHYSSVVEEFGLRAISNRKANTQFQRLIDEFYNKFGLQAVRTISTATRNRLLKVVLSEEDAGTGVSSMASAIYKAMNGDYSKYRAATIARTETHNAASYASDEVVRSMNIPDMKKRWVSVSDGRTRSHHSAMNGKTIPMDEDFEVSGPNGVKRMSRPADPRGGPENVINCRCLLVYIADEDAVFEDEGAVVSDIEPTVDIDKLLGDRFEVSPEDRATPSELISMLKSKLTRTGAAVVAKSDLPRAIKYDTMGAYNNPMLEVLTNADAEVFAHEYGHHIDNVLAGLDGPDAFNYWSKRGLASAYADDFKRIGLVDNDAKLEALFNELFTVEEVRNVRPSGRVRIRNVSKPNFAGARDISDLIDSLSNGRFIDLYDAYGHGSAYWRRGDGIREAEAFANMFAIMNEPKAVAWAKKNIPSLWAAFTAKMEEIANG